MKHKYFPGCSVDATAIPYQMSLREVARTLELPLEELEDWNCCGASVYWGVDELSSLCLSARNLALAEKEQEETLVTGCSGCFVALNKVNAAIGQYPHLRGQMEQVLKEAGLGYEGRVRVRHLLDVMVNDVGLEAVRSRVVRPLKGLKVACYYGCQISRPGGGFDDPEEPTSMDRLVEALGAEPVAFPLKARCCGGALMVSHPEVALGLLHQLLRSAHQNDASLMAVACPLCGSNLELFQDNVNERFHTQFRTPVLYFTQLMGLAMGIPQEKLGLDKSLVPMERS